MSNSKDRLRAESRPIIGGNPELTRADVYRAVEALERLARGLVKPSVRYTLHVLLSFLNKTTLLCNPSQETLSDAVRCNRGTVVQHLKLLEAAGLLVRVGMPVRQGRRSRESDAYVFAFERVGRPELRWKPPYQAKPFVRRPVRAADGTFRRAAQAFVQGEAVRNFADGADLVEVKPSVTLDDAPKAQASRAVLPVVSGRPWADPVALAAPVRVSDALAGLLAAMRERSERT